MIMGLVDIPRFPERAWAWLGDLEGLLDGLIVRDKTNGASSVKTVAKQIREQAPTLPLWINSYVSVAVGLSAEGLAVPTNFMRTSFLRSLWTKPIMSSVHHIQDLQYHRGADYYLWGHAFPSRSKPGCMPRPWSELENIVRSANVPVLAIGGITAHNIEQLAKTGIAGVCLADGLWLETDPIQACRQIRECMQSSHWKGSGACNATGNQWRRS